MPDRTADDQKDTILLPGYCYRKRRQKAVMDNVSRLRQARHEAVKLQRRIWLIQAAFWPTVLLTVVLIAVVAVRWLRRRQRVSSASIAPAPAQDAQAG